MPEGGKARWRPMPEDGKARRRPLTHDDGPRLPGDDFVVQNAARGAGVASLTASQARSRPSKAFGM